MHFPTHMTSLLHRKFGLLLFSISATALVCAYTLQYYFGMEPCILCIYDRIPHIVLAVIGLLYQFIQRKALVYSAIITSIIGALASFYHILVELGVVDLADFCNIDNMAPCNIHTTIMGIPLTYLNMILMLLVLFISLSQLGQHQSILGRATTTRGKND